MKVDAKDDVQDCLVQIWVWSQFKYLAQAQVNTYYLFFNFQCATNKLFKPESFRNPVLWCQEQHIILKIAKIFVPEKSGKFLIEYVNVIAL